MKKSTSKPTVQKSPATLGPARLVLDGSVTMAWLFYDEQEAYADAIANRLPAIELVVPRLWHLEVANVLIVSERRGRCTQADTTNWIGFLAGLPILVDTETEHRAWSDDIALARQHALTIYDAAYLELAVRMNLPIATLDTALIAAAEAMGVQRFQP